jgi:hypothetical protein
MKEILSLFTFSIAALCFVLFVTALKPDSVGVVSGSSKPDYCEISPNARLPPTRLCAGSWPDVSPR